MKIGLKIPVACLDENEYYEYMFIQEKKGGSEADSQAPELVRAFDDL